MPMNQSLTPGQLGFLADCQAETKKNFLAHGRRVSCPKGHLCLRAGEDNHSLTFILDGKVSVYNLTRTGGRKILFVLGSGHLANESVTGEHNSIFCETLEPCLFFKIPRKKVLSLMEQDFALTHALLSYQEQKIRRLEYQLKNTVGNVYLERKLASKLWKLARDFGIPAGEGILIDMDLTVTFLADLLGVPRENASRACRKFCSLGLIHMDKKRILIPDPEKLRSWNRETALRPFPKPQKTAVP
ncbi:MAG: Crp/Fnr family transcriptional regulator [Lachnospiraceae bacterium]|nr:Crp/Fnr family transcriptional regulator [Lachnospiraceae bacterium]